MSIIRRNFLFLPIAERIAMKSLIIALLIILSGITANARNFEVKGPQGGLSMTITLPDGFDKDNDSCPMVILMHGIFASKNIVPMSCSERFAEAYGETSELVVVEGENHMITKRLKKTVSHAVAFFEGIFKTETKTN